MTADALMIIKIHFNDNAKYLIINKLQLSTRYDFKILNILGILNPFPT